MQKADNEHHVSTYHLSLLNSMNTLSIIAALLALTGSCQPDSSLLEGYLTANGHGKYWDCIYSTSILGRINPTYATPSLDRPVTLPYDCEYFAAHQQVIHYANVDSSTVTDRGYSDVQFNPDKFELRDSLLFFSGHQHRILTLTPQVLVLEYEYEHRKSISVYLPSKYQAKRIKPLPR
ncbi:MAG: hypothetical protein EOO60_01800 [Hymenobacter sp.]|nr:MAG: hypothetical protein EOO60_01800 [Hymenobacter sp.]